MLIRSHAQPTYQQEPSRTCSKCMCMCIASGLEWCSENHSYSRERMHNRHIFLPPHAFYTLPLEIQLKLRHEAEIIFSKHEHCLSCIYSRQNFDIKLTLTDYSIWSVAQKTTERKSFIHSYMQIWQCLSPYVCLETIDGKVDMSWIPSRRNVVTESFMNTYLLGISQSDTKAPSTHGYY